MGSPQPAIFEEMGRHQWYIHLSRDTAKADLSKIAKVIGDLKAACEKAKINLVVGMGPSLLEDFAKHSDISMPASFSNFETVKSTDGSGREAIGTQEDLLFWLNSDKKDEIWKAQYDARIALKGEMSVARETMTFIYFNSLDMTGFIDGTGNPDPADQPAVALVDESEPGAGGSFILAQRWVHDLEGWNEMSIPEQEKSFGRTKADSVELETQEPYSHISHVDQTHGVNDIARRSTPYAFHDGTVGLYFMAFCKRQEPFQEMLSSMYGLTGKPRDRITDFSNPASGAFYFAPCAEDLAKITA